MLINMYTIQFKLQTLPKVILSLKMRCINASNCSLNTSPSIEIRDSVTQKREILSSHNNQHIYL